MDIVSLHSRSVRNPMYFRFLVSMISHSSWILDHYGSSWVREASLFFMGGVEAGDSRAVERSNNPRREWAQNFRDFPNGVKLFGLNFPRRRRKTYIIQFWAKNDKK